MSDQPTPPPELATAEASAQRGAGLSTLWMVLGVFAFVGLGLVFAFLSLGYYSSRRFASRSREAEGKVLLGTLSRALSACAERETGTADTAKIAGLPASAPPVPGRLSDVAGKGYQSVLSDWSHPSYTCAGFYTVEPQRFQLEWVRTSATTGTLFARSDENGDGKAEVTFEIDLRCEAPLDGGSPTCTRGPDVRERRLAFVARRAAESQEWGPAPHHRERVARALRGPARAGGRGRRPDGRGGQT